MSGVYTVSFTGQAVLSNVPGNPTLTFANQNYNAQTNTTTVNVTMPGGPTYADGAALMVISFTNTQLTPTSPVNTGIANLQVIRPGFTLAQAANPSQVFDPAFVSAFAPFGYMRFMDWLGTNTNPFNVSGCASAAPVCDPVGTPTMGWSQRSLPNDFYQGVGSSIHSTYPNRSGGWGIAWEYVVLLANATNKDVWINVPINATGSPDPYDPSYVAAPDTSSYVYNLAMLFKNGDAFTGNKGLNPGLHIYLEDSNEVWNWSFMQSAWNEGAATSEVDAAPVGAPSVLNNDGNTSSLTWAYRRHIKRDYEIAQIFESVFGPGSFGTIIRPVYTWWQLDEGSGSNAAAALAWFNTTYGPPANYLYAMAQGDYFTASNYANDTTIPLVLSDMAANSTASVSYVLSNKATAAQYGLPLYVYEGGPDNSNGGNQNTVNVGVQILANRDPEMDTLVQNHIRGNWFGQGGDLFGYFQLSGAYSRYGDYGATDDYRNLTTAKYNALVNLAGYTANGVPVAPGTLVATAGNSTVGLAWEAVPGAANYNVKRGLVSGGETTIATVSSPTYQDTAVTNGTTYYYVVTGVNTTGESAPSNEAFATPVASVPLAPALTAAAGNTQATLTWTLAAGAASYNVYEGTTSGEENTTPIATGVTLTSYTVTGLTNGTPYYFEVAAVNALGAGAVSNEATVTPVGLPAAPTGLAATIADGQSVLTWTASIGAASYNVYEGTVSGGEGTTPIATGITSVTYTVTGLTDATAYFFTVAAVNGAGTSGPSNEVATTPASPGVLLTFEPFGEAAGNLNDASGGGDFGWATSQSGWPASVYDYGWAVGAGSDPSTDDTYNVASTTPLTYPGLLTSGSYVAGAGTTSSDTVGRYFDLSTNGALSSYLTTGPDSNLVGAPGTTLWFSYLARVDGTLTPDGTYGAVLSSSFWSPWATWASSAAMGYFGQLGTDGQAYWSLQDGSGNVYPSNVPVVAGQPALLVLEMIFGQTGGQSQVNLYVNPTSLGGAAPTTPSAQFATTNNLSFATIALEADESPNDTIPAPASFGDIRMGSNFAAVTPAPVVPIPAAPTGLTATAGDGQVTLSWNASAGATSYQVWSTVGGNYGESGSAVTGTGTTLLFLRHGQQ
jgi:fibronectin type 3 domain-containing protein